MLDSVTDSVDMNLSKLQKTVKDREAWCAPVHGVKVRHDLVTGQQQKYIYMRIYVCGNTHIYTYIYLYTDSNTHINTHTHLSIYLYIGLFHSLLFFILILASVYTPVSLF